MNINDITMGMTPQEKETYFNHMAKRHAQEQEALAQRKQELRAWRETLIDEIMAKGSEWTRECLNGWSTRSLEATAGY